MSSERAAPAQRLERMSRMRDYAVEGREPDPRGWTVVDRDGRAVGEVKDLFVDVDRMSATYLDVELDAKAFDLGGDDPHVLVPVQRAHRDGRRLVVDDISREWVADLRSARERDRVEFWDRWWDRSAPRRDRDSDTVATARTRRVEPDHLQRVIDEVRPGQEVRIPVVKEEIVVERRPIEREEIVTNRAVDEPPRRR
jgi:sporulation protein YlmC with PRC-barrel domain